MVTIRTYGGLGNRIRSIDSLLSLAKENKTEMTVIWDRTPTLNCKFSRLFSLPDYVKVKEVSTPNSMLAMKLMNVFRKVIKKAGLKIPLGYKEYIFEEDMTKLRDENYDFHALFETKNLFVETQHRFYSDSNDFELFTPVKEIRDRVSPITSNYSGNTIGVHIRRTDNQKSIDNSPLELFVQRMNDEIKKDANTIFFLATDSVEEEKKLKDMFPGKILTQENKILGRNDPRGIQDALVDMLCLSETKKIYGSFWSSFSEIAAAIGKIDIHIVTKDS